MNSLHDFNQSHSPPGFEFRQFEGCVILYRLKFDDFLQFPTTLEFIRTDKDLHVKLQYNGIDCKGKELKGNLRKALKLCYQALHPGNNKQNVPLTLALFHDTTIAAAKIF